MGGSRRDDLPVPGARINECGHPERRHESKGKCRKCYLISKRKVHACTHCGRAYRSDGTKRKYCRTCSPPGDQYAAKLLRLYGLSREDFNVMYHQQGGTCAIDTCDRKAVHVDHCHETGRVRGLLCAYCNVRLECVENPTWLEAAQEYLAKREYEGILP